VFVSQRDNSRTVRDYRHGIFTASSHGQSDGQVHGCIGVRAWRFNDSGVNSCQCIDRPMRIQLPAFLGAGSGRCCYKLEAVWFI